MTVFFCRKTLTLLTKGLLLHAMLPNHVQDRFLILSHSPWRSGDDLACTHQTCQVLYSRHQYEYHSEILHKAVDDMNNAKSDNFDIVAPNAEHTNKQDYAISKLKLIYETLFGKTRLNKNNVPFFFHFDSFSNVENALKCNGNVTTFPLHLETLTIFSNRNEKHRNHLKIVEKHLQCIFKHWQRISTKPPSTEEHSLKRSYQLRKSNAKAVEMLKLVKKWLVSEMYDNVWII